MFNIPRMYVDKLCKDCGVKGSHFIDVECYLAKTHSISYRVFCEECWDTALNLNSETCMYRYHIVPFNDWVRVVNSYFTISEPLN